MQEDCKAAMDMENPELGGSRLSLKMAPDRKIFNDKNKSLKLGQEPSSRISKSKARLIIRNLSFKSNEDSLNEFFSKHGQVVDVNILKKPDGKMVGCAFVEFKKVESAAEAIKRTNGARFLNRPIAVDWAVPKEVFASKNDVKPDIEDVKEEVVEDDKTEVKMETSDNESDDDDNDDDDDEADEADEDEETDEEEGEEGDDDSEDEDDPMEDDSDEEVENESSPPAHNLQTGHDINEGKTVFVRNISFDTEEEDLAALMREYFGPVVFARLVMDKEMGHPRGTGFVKFKRREDAEKCCETGAGSEGIFLDNRQLFVMMAKQRNDVEQLQKERKEKEPKDNRNLYLAREGIIREGTAAAEGVSKSDMERRKVVQKQKKMMLKNLNMFVSSTRLCVRNLPPYVDDSKLKTIFAKNVPKSAKIVECKVLREKVAGTGVEKQQSKGFAFVSFSKHEDALLALRNVNNNPEVFTNDRRPIVEFSIENRKALLARQKRLEKSRDNNPNFQSKKGGNQKLVTLNNQRDATAEKTKFSGMTSDPKQKGLPTHSGPKVRTGKKNNKISRKDLKKQEQERRNPKKKKQREDKLKVMPAETQNPAEQAKTEKKKQKKQKKMSRDAQKEVDNEKKFTSLVKSYVKNIKSNDKIAKKWFET